MRRIIRKMRGDMVEKKETSIQQQQRVGEEKKKCGQMKMKEMKEEDFQTRKGANITQNQSFEIMHAKDTS